MIGFVIHKKNRQLRALMIGEFIGVLSGSAFLIGMPLLFTQILGLNPEHLSGVIAIVAGLTIISPLVAEKVANTRGIRNALFALAFLIGLMIFGFAFSSSVILAIIFFSLYKIFGAMTEVIGESAYHHTFDSKIRASLSSASNMIWSTSYSIGVFLTGILIALFGVVTALMIAGSLSLLEGIVYFIGLEKD